jgi:hypothetical protein
MGFDRSERYRQDAHDPSYQLAAEQPGRGRFQQQRGSRESLCRGKQDPALHSTLRKVIAMDEPASSLTL